MSLENTVVIKIRRRQSAGAIELQQASQLAAVEGPVYSLFEQAKTQLNRSAGKHYGFFDKDAQNQQFPALLGQWQNNAIDFLGLANRASANLQEQLAATEAPFAGVLLFAEESLLGQHYLYIFWLPLVDAIQVGNDLAPFNTQVVEAGQMPYALRLHVDAWQDNESPKYLTILAGRGNKAFSEGFKAFCNFSEGVDVGQQTKEFLQIVDTFSDKLPEEQGKAVKTAVINYCVEKDKIGNPVLIEELSEQLSSEAPRAFAEFVSSQQATPQAEILTDRASLKRYMRYFGRDHSLSISFSAERFGSDIQYDAQNGTLNISKIPKSLKIQLSGYAEKNE